jgi:hypothetical protein
LDINIVYIVQLIKGVQGSKFVYSWPVYRAKRSYCSAFEADMHRKFLILDEGHVFDKESHHPLPFPVGDRLVLPGPFGELR